MSGCIKAQAQSRQLNAVGRAGLIMAAPLFDNIPEELKGRRQWVLWRVMSRGGKLTKVPYQPTGVEGDSSDPGTWSSYHDVEEAYQKGGYDGIGYVFDTLDPYAGVDLDHCINEDGSMLPEAKAILDKLNSYSEISPSGTGIKIFLKAKNPVSIRTKDNKFKQGFESKKPGNLEIEIYYGYRFFTLTGDVLQDYSSAVEDRNQELTDIFKKVFKSRNYFNSDSEPGSQQEQERNEKVEPLSSDAVERLQELFAADPFFKDNLYTPAPIGKRSDAEFHLCARLWEAAFTEPEIYAIMNFSPQTKWLRRDDTYRWDTIRKAVAKAEASHQGTQTRADENSNDLTEGDVIDIEYPVNKNGDEIPGAEPKETFNHSRATDAILKKLPVALGEDDLLYYWHGKTWQPNAESVVFNKVRALAGNVFNIREQKEIIVALKHALTFNRVNFDPSPELLGLTNGTLNCKTGEFREYRREDLITDPVPITFDREARCPEILKFIEGVTPNYDDRITLLDIIASGAYRKALAYVAFLLGGGSSGSTKIIELIQAVYGAKTTEAVPLNELAEKQFALSSLKNARYSIGQEIEDMKKAGTSRIKEISGGDWISADVKNVQERARFRGWTKLIFKGNSVPRFTDSTWGFKRRFVEVPLPYKFVSRIDPDEPDQRLADPDILDKITTQEELSGLLNVMAVRLPWIIENRQIYCRSGQHDAYKRQVDSVSTFLEEFCAYYSDSLGVRIPIKKVHEHFEKWCNLIRGNLVDRRQFGGYVKRYCNNKPGLETTINGKTETVYPGLTFDQEKFDEEIRKLQSQLKPDIDRIDTGSNTGLKSSQMIPNTGYTGLKSIVDPIQDISAKTLWNEIISMAGRTRPLCSGVPVSDSNRHGESKNPLRSYPVPSRKPTPKDAKSNPVNPVPITAEAGKKASKSIVDSNGAKPAIGPHPRKDGPTPTKKPEPAPVDPLRTMAITLYGMHGRVDPRSLVKALHISEGDAISRLQALDYVAYTGQNGQTYFKQRTTGTGEVKA
jgi:putative DNA primase/helicase